jgi:hypothetical protein
MPLALARQSPSLHSDAALPLYQAGVSTGNNNNNNATPLDDGNCRLRIRPTSTPQRLV